MAKGVPETHPEERGALNWSPKQNWVDKAGGLPDYVRSVAIGMMKSGMPRERAIPAAVSVIKKACSTGRWGPGAGKPISPAIRAAACKAASEWEAKKGKSDLSACADCSKSVELATVVTSSRAQQPSTTNALLKPPKQLKPRHLKLLARANANLAKRGMPKSKRKVVMRSMAKQMKAGKGVRLAAPKGEAVELAFNPSQLRASKGSATGGQWTLGQVNSVAALTASQQGQKIAPGGQNPQSPAAIAALQKQLGVPPTGVYDAQTRSAVLAFQKAYGLKQDGIAGNQTLGTLHAARVASGHAAPSKGRGRASSGARKAASSAKAAVRTAHTAVKHNQAVKKRQQATRKRQARLSQQKQKALAKARQLQQKAGLKLNRHERALVARAGGASNQKARVQAAKALAKSLRYNASAKAKQTRVQAKVARIRAAAARKAGRAQATTARKTAAATARTQRQTATSQRQQTAAAARAARQQQAAQRRQVANAVRTARALKAKPKPIPSGVSKARPSGGRLKSTIV